MPTHGPARRERPDLLAVAHDGALLADAFGVPHRPQPPPERVRDRSPRRRPASPATTRTSRASAPRWRPCCATPAGARSGSARTTTRRSTRGRWARRRRTGRSASGYDRFYGFLGGETNQWYPDLAEDNHYVEQPYGPEDGYHLSKDLADKALEFIRDSKQSEPDKPWYLWFCPGANHAPHHAPQEYIDKYKGAFDDGYEAYREWVLPRMIEKGILPEGTELTPTQPDDAGHVQRGRLDAAVGHALRRREAALLAHGRGVRRASRSTRTRRSAGSSTTSRSRASSRTRSSSTAPTTAPRARAARTARSTRTSSSTRGPTRSRTTCRSSTSLGRPRHVQPLPDRLGGGLLDAVPDVQALLLPGRRLRPARDPLAEGDRRREARCATSTTTARTSSRRSSTAAASSMPEVVDGYEQTPLPGVSMRYSFDAADAPTQKETQYYEMLGTRGIWHKGWKAVAEHGPVPLNLGKFDEDRWQLFHTDEDRSEAHDLAEQHPEKLEELKALWLEEAEKLRRPAAQRPRHLRVPRARVRDRRAGERPVHLLPRARARSRRRRRRARSTSRTRSSRRSSSRPTPRA